MKTVFEIKQFEIKVEQSEATGKLFRITYFKQVRSNLDYAEASKELGECVFHALACESILDNTGF